MIPDMLGGRLKFTDAEQRSEEFRRQSSRMGWLLWTPLYVLMLVALWAGAIHQFFKHSDIAWPSLGAAIALSISGFRMWKARH